MYVGAEPKAKILAKNSVDTTEEDVEEENTEDETETVEEETITNTEEMEQPIKNEAQGAVVKNLSKAQVLNTLVELAKNSKLNGLTRQEVKEAVTNAVDLKDTDGTTTYVVPDAVFTEILASTRDTDILGTLNTKPVRRLTVMAEVRSEADLARAGKWTKGQQKAIQANQLKAQKFGIDYIYKMQEIDYADLNEDFGGILLSYIHSELPQKVDEEEERAFIVGDGRGSGVREITSVISLDAAAEDATNTHVYDYDGSADAGTIQAVMNGIAKMGEDGTLYAVMNKGTLTAMRQLGFSASNGLPFSVETVADSLGVSKIFTRDYVADNTVYVYSGNFIFRLTGGMSGETIEQYDIDYNNRKIEFIRPTGGGGR